jgi:hopanoid biosynthesis associated protein HpnK
LNSQTVSSGLRKRLIVTADDLGLTRRINDAIAKTHREGIVTTASLMVNGAPVDAFESAIEMLRANPELDAGLHLNLTEGRPASLPERIPGLANSRGFLYHHPFELMVALLRGKVQASDLETEIRAQFQKTLDAGAQISHVDGHKHVHVVPGVFRIVCRVAPEYGVRAIRSTVERVPRVLMLRSLSTQIAKQYLFGKALSGAFVLAQSGNRLRSWKTPRRLYGITQTGFLDLQTFADILSRMENGISEVMCHPGYVDDDLRKTPTRLHFQRERELDLLTGHEVRDLLERAGIGLATYRDL